MASNTFCISSPSSGLPSQFLHPFSDDDFSLDGAAFSSPVLSYLRGFSRLRKPEKPAYSPPNLSPLPPCTRVSLSALLSESVSSLFLCLRLPIPPCYLVSLPALLSESVSSLSQRLWLPLPPCYLVSLPSLPSESVSSLSLCLRLPLPPCYPIFLRSSSRLPLPASAPLFSFPLRLRLRLWRLQRGPVQLPAPASNYSFLFLLLRRRWKGSLKKTQRRRFRFLTSFSSISGVESKICYGDLYVFDYMAS
ncbi:hypothetical protein ACLOJK_022267 [Asimina triloba]